MTQIMYLVLRAIVARTIDRDDRGEGAVPWLIVLGAGISIAYFAGESVFAFAKTLVAGLGGD